MNLVPVCPETFKKIVADWSDQCSQFDEDFSDFAVHSISHAKEIVDGKHEGKKYGIFTLNSGGEYHLLAHLNVAPLPKTTGTTLRILWILLAPKYDFDDTPADRLASMVADLFASAIELSSESNGFMEADHVKVHLSGIADRRFFAGMAYGFERDGKMMDVAIRGNWLHMSHTRSETKC